MPEMDRTTDRWRLRVVSLSLLLLLFVVPHVLEDFATGQPAEADVPAAVLAFVVSVIIALQALSLFWLGQQHRRGLLLHVGIGLFWPMAAGAAQLPTILSGALYRSGVISVAYVAGMIVVGILLSISSMAALRVDSRTS